jgi:hypothetical protein
MFPPISPPRSSDLRVFRVVTVDDRRIATPGDVVVVDAQKKF